MRYDTVPEFASHHDSCYDLGELNWLFEDLFVYQNKTTGQFEAFDRELDYQYTLFPWVNLTGRPHLETYPDFPDIDDEEGARQLHQELWISQATQSRFEL